MSFLGGLFGSGNSASQAAMAQLQQGIDFNKQVYSDAQANYNPYMQAGTAGLSEMLMRMGLGGDSSNANFGSLLKSFDSSQMDDESGYKFRQQQGENALNRKLAASGKYLNPEAAKSLATFNQDLASQEYQNAYNRNMSNKQNIASLLGGLTSGGLSAVGGLSGVGTNVGGTLAGLYGSMANASAASKQNNTLSNLMNLGLGAAGIYSGFGWGGNNSTRGNNSTSGNDGPITWNGPRVTY